MADELSPGLTRATFDVVTLDISISDDARLSRSSYPWSVSVQWSHIYGYTVSHKDHHSGKVDIADIPKSIRTRGEVGER